MVNVVQCILDEFTVQIILTDNANLRLWNQCQLMVLNLSSTSVKLYQKWLLLLEITSKNMGYPTCHYIPFTHS